MKFKKFSPDTVAELLTFLADRESFESTREIKNISREDVRLVFSEIAAQLKEVAQKQPVLNKFELKKEILSEQTNQVLSNLAPHEEEALFKSFKIG